ncbi:hypothetical protein Ac2012v2_006972 [Leucoagaricus gongylophorus]
MSLSDKSDSAEFDPYSYHEQNAGRLIINPEEARRELGEMVASKLKLTEDGTKILWPQPTDSPMDPQNWSEWQKTVHLLILILVSIVPDFDSGLGIAALFPLARTFNTNVNVINNVSSNWSIFLIGIGGIFAVMVMRKFGRLPVLFWSQILGLGFLIGCTFAPNLPTFAAMRSLSAFFATTPQVTGLFVVTDMYPFHQQAKKINSWTFGFIISPFLSPFACGFLAAREDWRWTYATGCFYSAFVIILMALFMKETMYDRTLNPIPIPETTGLRNHIETLFGITGWKMAKYRPPWKQIVSDPIRMVWRPHVLPVLIFEAAVFGFGIGINVTNAVFLGEPFPLGYGFDAIIISALYATPIVAVLVGEIVGHFLNDLIMERGIRKNSGVHEAESRFWACYLGIPLFICGFLVIGASFQNHLPLAAIIMGWGIAEFSIMIMTVVVYAYLNDCFPKNQGEVSALITLARILGGFAVAYFQVPWAARYGAIQTYGVEAAYGLSLPVTREKFFDSCTVSIVSALFLFFIPVIQLKGPSLRKRYSLQ